MLECVAASIEKILLLMLAFQNLILNLLSRNERDDFSSIGQVIVFALSFSEILRDGVALAWFFLGSRSMGFRVMAGYSDVEAICNHHNATKSMTGGFSYKTCDLLLG